LNCYSAPSKGWLDVDEKMRCKPSMVSSQNPGPDDDKQITGREFTEGLRTCDLYPIAKDRATDVNDLGTLST